MEEQPTNELPLETPVIKESEPAPKKTGSNKLILVVLGFFILSTIGLVIIVAYLFFTNSQKPDDIIDPEVTTTPTSQPDLTPTPDLGTNTIYYIEEGLVYKRDLESQESELLPLGEVEWGSESSLAGVSYPLISNDETKIAYLPTRDKVSVYNLVKKTTRSASLPQPEVGSVEAYISGFNKASNKLLLYVECPSPMDEYGDDFEFCPDDFLEQKIGLYVFDLETGTTQKVATQNDEWLSYDNLIGWVNYDDDKFVVTKSEYQNNSLSQTKVFEIDTKTNTHSLLQSFPAGSQNVTVWDFDDLGNMLYQKYDGSKWGLYLDNDLIKEESGFTSMQFPLFLNGRNDRVSYYSNTNTSIDFKLVDLEGNILEHKEMSFSDETPI